MPLRIHQLALPALLFAPCLMGCAIAPQLVMTPAQQVPAVLWLVPAQPDIPAPSADDTTLANWTLDTVAAGETCRVNLAGIRKALGQ
jgi:hypothetical protein